MFSLFINVLSLGGITLGNFYLYALKFSSFFFRSSCILSKRRGFKYKFIHFCTCYLRKLFLEFLPVYKIFSSGNFLFPTQFSGTSPRQSGNHSFISLILIQMLPPQRLFTSTTHSVLCFHRANPISNYFLVYCSFFSEGFLVLCLQHQESDMKCALNKQPQNR